MDAAEIALLLPGVIQRTTLPGNPLAALLAVMEDLHAPDEAILARLEIWFTPYQTPDDFVPFLARWVDLERLLVATPEAYPTTLPPFSGGVGRLRELVAAAAYLSKWRGTARGLLRFLELATGIQGFGVEEQVPAPDGRPRPFHIRIRAPAAAQTHQELITRIVEMEKPAYLTWELVIEL